jgi:hypothetical protein
MNDALNEAVKQAATDVAKEAGETAVKGFWERIFVAYHGFIGMFPDQFQWIVSLVIVLILASLVWSLVKKNWFWIILLFALFPGLLPVLKNIFDSLTTLLVGKPLD